MEIEVGSVYKVDHSKLPTPSLLPASIRAVLVEGKTDEEVALLFPTTESLQRFFSDEKRTGLMQPNLNEKYVMGLNLVKKFLTQKIPFEEFASQRGTRSFWTVDFDHDDHQKPSRDGLDIKWGKRRRTTLYGKHRAYNQTTILPHIVKNFDDNDDHEAASMEEDYGEKKIRTLRKRKCKLEGVKYSEKKKKQTIKGDNQKRLINAQHRWNVERYKLAEKNMLEIMKAKGAVPGNPILRPDLRSEARKLIGDTGLLDHLLKHMAGKLAPGGKERFRRRHNPEGAMEYWLESADLIDIRKREGIDDPFWNPPPGWQPGDCPNQDPVCAKGFKELRDEVAYMKREIGKLASQGQGSNQALMTTQLGVGPEGDERFNFLGSLKPHMQAIFAQLLKRKDHIEKQLFDISKSLSGMEEEIGKLKGPASIPKAVSQVTEKETKRLAEGVEEQDKGNKNGAFNEAATLQDREKKEERRQRLKSGFRICKPQGTFLWPDSQMPSSSHSQVVVHLEDLLGYPTPPSVSSSSCRVPPDFLLFPPPPPPPPPLQPYHLRGNHQSPVKRPVAKRASVTLTFSTSTIRGSTTIDNMIASPTDTTGSNSVVHTFHVPDLNESPLSPFT